MDIVIGYSLGGYIAINLAKKFQIDRLILLCPAIYSDQAVKKCMEPNLRMKSPNLIAFTHHRFGFFFNGI